MSADGESGFVGTFLAEVVDNKKQTSSGLLQEGSAPGNCWGFHSGCVFEAWSSCSLFCNSFPFKNFVFLTGGLRVPGATLALPISSSCSWLCKLSQLSGGLSKETCVCLSLHSCPSSSEAQRGEKTSGRYLWCVKPQMGATVVWDRFPSGFPWQVFVHRACGKADSCWKQALHPSFSTLTPIQGLELLEAGRVSLPSTEEVVLK